MKQVYDTYLQCKQAHPSKKVMTTAPKWEEDGGNVDMTGKFVPYSNGLCLDDEWGWVEAVMPPPPLEQPLPPRTVTTYLTITTMEQLADAIHEKKLYSYNNHVQIEKLTEDDVNVVASMSTLAFAMEQSDISFCTISERPMTEQEEFVAWGIELSGCEHTSVAPSLRHAFVRMYENGVRKP